MTDPYSIYLQNEVQTAPPQRLVLLLYDGALKFIGQAREASCAGDRTSTRDFLLRAQDVLAELMATLNMDAGPIANNLYSLYDYILGRLVEANLHKELAPMEEAYSMLEELRTTWAQAMHL